MSEVLRLAQDLIARASVTPEDSGCQALIAERLARAGFHCESLEFGAVKNLWATHGEGAPVFVLLGHTDVVPPGPPEAWASDPFKPEVRDGRLYGRGAADMKGSVAAFVLALENFVANNPRHPGTVALLLTSDEEGDAIDGVRRVAEHFRASGQRIDFCLVGEPSSAAQLGDVVRIGRRGSLTGAARIKGVQGHVAYPDKACNPIHAALPVLQQLMARDWDSEPYPDFPRTSFQIANFNAGTGASNVIPGEATVQFNLRYSPRWTADALVAEIAAQFARHGVDVEITWHRSGEPFHTAEGRLRDAVREALAARSVAADENTGGGTSDGRFIAPLGAEVVELGPVNASIHKVDECIAISELEALPALYREIVERTLLG
ncbi:MAG TPA: succinyl-diaminopimelate desuccinylase [Arenimonas sp.]|nr:succinyl-diaminopimelate desuccinylase [Arenimonas sp.]